jgi:hypothetical protein
MTQLAESPHRYTTRRPGDRRPVPSRLRLRSIRQPARLRLSSVARRDVPWIALRSRWTERSRDRRILYFRILSQSFGYWYSFNALTGEFSAKGCRELFQKRKNSSWVEAAQRKQKIYRFESANKALDFVCNWSPKSPAVTCLNRSGRRFFSSTKKASMRAGSLDGSTGHPITSNTPTAAERGTRRLQ